MTIIISLVVVACNNAIAQTLETITNQRTAFENNPQIKVKSQPGYIAINQDTNKIYITRSKSGIVSVIDSNSGSGTKDIRVGDTPNSIAIDSDHNKIYVANGDSNTVSVIDGNSDTEIGQIAVGAFPKHIVVLFGKIYVANYDNDTVSVISVAGDKKKPHDIPVGSGPTYIAADYYNNMIYVANNYSNTVSVIDGTTGEKKTHDIPVGSWPSYIAVDSLNDKIYVANSEDNTVSVINATNDRKESHDIRVGEYPSHIAVNRNTGMIYVVNELSNTVSVIDGFSDKVAAGVTFNILPANSGKIICNSKEYPTNIYLFVDAGTHCTVQPNKDFQFSGWIENGNRNSTIPLDDSSGDLIINRYGTFTANFKALPPAIPPEFWLLLVGIILSSLIGWSIPSIMGWLKARTQRKYLKECLTQIGKLDKKTDEEKITTLYIERKITDSDRQLLNDKIAEYYNNTNGSDGSPIK